jgi:hypothetical protein
MLRSYKTAEGNPTHYGNMVATGGVVYLRLAYSRLKKKTT